MACPTCDHTMESMGYANGGTIWHCPRCGTVQHYDHFVDAPPKVYVPKLVDRCRKMPAIMSVWPLAFEQTWHSLGIAESINLPENRSN